jgi:hypothetical protein
MSWYRGSQLTILSLSWIPIVYGIRFKTMEVLRLKNVGDLQALIDRKAS